MKTVFVTTFQAVEAKNILRTDVIRSLLCQENLRVVCLTRNDERISYYQKEIPHARIIYEAVYHAPSGVMERLFSFLKFHLIKTATTDLKRYMHFERSGSHLRYILGAVASRVFAKSIVRRFFRVLDYYLINDSGFGVLFEKYQPDVVFCANLFDDVEVSLLREAKRAGIPTIGFVNSWDKLTARASLRLLPDKLLVFNEIVKAEAIRYADMFPDRVIISGIPHYDQYANKRPSSREEFFRKIGCDPAKQMVLYAPMGAKFSDSDWEIIDFLQKALASGRVGPGAELFVRFQPNDFVNEKELARRPWLKYDMPGIRFGTERGGDWDMRFSELDHLTDTLAHLSLIICYASSIAIDAAIFDKPVIGVHFEIKKGQSLAKSPTQYYYQEHYKKALSCGGIRLVNDGEELIEAINGYLANPTLDRAGRRRLVETQCFKVDGRAGERIASVILGAVQ